MERTRLEWAQWMASKGISVFIVEPEDKRPLGGKSWISRCSMDPEQIAKWFAQTPNCNYGLWLGEDHVVVDLDLGANKNGIRAFEELGEKHGVNVWLELDTLTVKTPSGGHHLYFKVDDPIANANKMPVGIDVRGASGYVVGPGCEIIDEYGEVNGYFTQNEDAGMMQCPDWLLGYMKGINYKDPNRHNPHCEWDLPENIEQARVRLLTEAIAVEGEAGDHRTYEVCCLLRDFGLSEEQTFLTMNDETEGPSWNARCEPPWDDGELKAKIDHAQRYAANRPGCLAFTFKQERHLGSRPAGGFFNEEEKKLLSGKVDDLDRFMEERKKARKRLEIDDIEDDGIPIPPADDGGYLDAGTSMGQGDEEEEQRWFGFQDFMARDNIREYIIKDWLIAHGVTALLAKRGTGKSTVALDLACHLALDMKWHGTEIQKGWKVIYICGEDDEGMILNCRAWDKEHGKSPSNDRFLVSKDIIKLTDRDMLLHHLKKMVEWAGDSRCLIILDTWARATSGASANAQEEMDAAYENAETVAAALNGPMIACFHPPKEGKMTIRGSAMQEDASSGIWTLEGTASNLTLTITRAKGKGHGRYRHFELKPIELEGVDSYNEPLSGIVAINTGGTETEGTVSHIEKHDKKLRAWARMVIGCQQFPATTSHYEALTTMNREQVNKFLVLMSEDAGRYDPKNRKNLSENVQAKYADAQSFMEQHCAQAVEANQTVHLKNAAAARRGMAAYFDQNEGRAAVEFADGWVVEWDGKLFTLTKDESKLELE